MIIDKDLILFDLTGDKETIISTLANQAFEQGRLEDKQKYIEAVLKREKEYSTALGYEVAIPHGSEKEIINPKIVIATLKKPILWNQHEVQIVFLIAMNMLEPQVTKNTLKDLYAIMDNKQAMQVLSNAKDAKEIIHYLKGCNG